MDILIVEDAARDSDALIRRLSEHNWRIARTRDEASAELLLGAPDLVVCDLRIPPENGGMAHTDHGLAVFDDVRARWPGVPVRILSGHGDIDMVDERLRLAGGMAGHIKKDNVDQLMSYIKELAAEQTGLATIELDWVGPELPLEKHDRRLIQKYASAREASVVRVRELAGGKSGAITLALTLIEGPASASQAVVKLNTRAEILDEHGRYTAHVADRVAIGAYTPVSECITAYAGARSGLFYRLADGFDANLFDLVREDPEKAATVVERIAGATRAWRQVAEPKQITVAYVRRMLVRDEVRLGLLEEAPWSTNELEALEIRANVCRQHGDLHGENVLVNGALQPMLIDYGRSGPATASLDAVTLEISAVLHPAAGLALGEWLDDGRAEQWPDLDTYVAGCPIEPFIRACRAWAEQVSVAKREVLATGYAYALRQLRYPNDVDPQLAAALSLGAARALKRSFGSTP
jgi:DNA-binding NarL/FixJ family response regulator